MIFLHEFKFEKWVVQVAENITFAKDSKYLRICSFYKGIERIIALISC